MTVARNGLGRKIGVPTGFFCAENGVFGLVVPSDVACSESDMAPNSPFKGESWRFPACLCVNETPPIGLRDILGAGVRLRLTSGDLNGFFRVSLAAASRRRFEAGVINSNV